MSVSYRRAIAADGPVLAATGRRVFAETFGPHFGAADLARHLERSFGPGGLPAELADPAIRIMLAEEEEEGAAIGYLKLGPVTLPIDHPPGALEIKQLYILQPWQGRGVAASLMDWAIRSAREEGSPALFLSVWSEGARAQAFYRRYGFEVVGAAPFRLGDTVLLDPVMRLDL